MENMIRNEFSNDIRLGRTLTYVNSLIQKKIPSYNLWIEKLMESLSKEEQVTDICKRFSTIYNYASIEYTIYIIFIIYILRDKFKKSIDYALMDTLLLERLYIRILLIKDGWNDRTIENLLMKHYNIEKNENYFIIYLYLRKLMNTNNKIVKRGRPEIPNNVKTILNKRQKETTMEKMRNIYLVHKNIYKDIHKLFTSEDINYLSELIPDNKKELKEKLNILSKYS
jgi:hypothetical protein